MRARWITNDRLELVSVIAATTASALFVSGCGPGRHEPTTPSSDVSYEAGTSPMDRDGDGLVDDDQDYLEAGLSPRRPAPPAEPEVCGDQEDNDSDGDVDCDDADCAVLPECQAAEPGGP
jgi:hypothetical protein